MMTLLEFCDEFRISRKKAKRMQKRGVLVLAEDDAIDLARIREVFVQCHELSAIDLCALIEEPSLVTQMGRYAGKALDQIEPLGEPLKSPAPREVSMNLMDAAQGDPNAISALVDWIKGVLPGDSSPVGFHWLAVRLLLPFPANIRKFENDRIRRALLRCRKSEEFAGWWKYERKSGRNFTVYARPNSLALMDL